MCWYSNAFTCTGRVHNLHTEQVSKSTAFIDYFLFSIIYNRKDDMVLNISNCISIAT